MSWQIDRWTGVGWVEGTNSSVAVHGRRVAIGTGGSALCNAVSSTGSTGWRGKLPGGLRGLLSGDPGAPGGRGIRRAGAVVCRRYRRGYGFLRGRAQAGGEVKGEVKTIVRLLTVGVEWMLIKRATGITPSQFQALKVQLWELSSPADADRAMD